jgi:TonB family protein
MERPSLWFWGFALSAVAHVALLWRLGSYDQQARVQALQTFEFEIRGAPPEPAPPEPEPEPEPEPSRAANAALESPEPERAANESPAPTPAESQALEASVAAPLDLSGVTLTSAGSGDFSMKAGSGAPLSAPAVKRGTQKRAAPAGSPAPQGPAFRIVPLANLSRRPAPPNLRTALERFYPAAKRQAGIEGSARLRARIDPDGHIRQTEPLSSSASDFAEACRRALTGSKWSPPLDMGGEAVATWIVYSCAFQVGS